MSDDIMVIVVCETNKKTGLKELIVSHGIDMVTGWHITLPCERPQDIGAKFDIDIGEYMIYGK